MASAAPNHQPHAHRRAAAGPPRSRRRRRLLSRLQGLSRRRTRLRGGIRADRVAGALSPASACDYLSFFLRSGLTLHISGPPRGNQSTITPRVSAAPLHVVVRHVESGRTVIAACLLRPYRRAVRSTAVPRAADRRLVCRMQGLSLGRGRLGAAADSRRDVRSASVLLAFADPATLFGLRGPNAPVDRARAETPMKR